jgi:HEPN domain-containing protein
LKLNPINEILYRINLARKYLEEAEKAYSRSDWRTTVSSSQLSAENSGKAVIAFYRIPSWSHDPSPELLEIISRMPSEMTERVKRLAEITRLLAPEHGRSTYGEPLRGLTPWDIYSDVDAEKSLRMAREAFHYAVAILRELGVDVEV